MNFCIVRCLSHECLRVRNGNFLPLQTSVEMAPSEEMTPQSAILQRHCSARPCNYPFVFAMNLFRKDVIERVHHESIQ